MNRPKYMRCAMGERIIPTMPEHTPIVLETIAHVLANICRFGGHCEFYSVAAHSLHVSRLLEATHGTFGAIVGLLHDAHEAYTGDVMTPVKDALGPAWDAFEARWARRVRCHFALPPDDDPIWRACKHADRVAMVTEGLSVMPNSADDDWRGVAPDPLGLPTARYARDAFLLRAHALGLR